MTLGVRKMKLLGVCVVAILAMSTSACSSLPTTPDWVDPTTWFGSDDSDSYGGQAPDLASLPNAPAVQPSDDKRKVVEALASDRANAKYSAEALRGGTEVAAAPPPDIVPSEVAKAEEIQAPPTAVAEPEPVQTAMADNSVALDPDGSVAAGTLPATKTGAPVAVAAAKPAEEPVETAALTEPVVTPVKPVETRRIAPQPYSTPAPQAPAAQTMVASVSPSDAELGFKPSIAPPLDPSVSQFVAAPIIDHYRRTAASAGMRTVAMASTARTKPLRRPAPVAVGGPEQMEGKVVANLDVLGQPPGAAQVASTLSGASVVVYFPHDIVGLNAAGREQVRAAAELYLTNGGQGYIRVVGHSSSRTPNMSAERHLQVIFKKSQDRADAVARELIRAGVPADRVLVEAVGDSQPIYYESMPKGEEGNRRAEIFLQS